MGYFLGFILFFFFLFLAIGISIISRLVGGVSRLFRMVFGKETPRDFTSKGSGNGRRRVGETTLHTTDEVQKKKIIGEDEGEYVDFEELPPEE